MQVFEDQIRHLNTDKIIRRPHTKYCDDSGSFGLALCCGRVKTTIPLKPKEYTHSVYKTKGYLDKTCAEFKVLKMYEKLIFGFEEIFLRVPPIVEKITTLNNDRILYRGYIRLSVFKGEHSGNST